MDTESTVKRSREGMGFLLLSVLFNGAAFHFARAALATASPATAAVVGCFSASCVFFLCGWLWRRGGWRVGALHALGPSAVWRCLRTNPVAVGLAPVAAALSSVLMNYTNKNYGPELTAFLANQVLVFLVLGGLALGERITPLETLTILFILAGAFLFSYRGGRFQLAALGVMSLCCFFVALKQLLIRKVAMDTPLAPVMVANLMLTCLWAAGMGVATGTLLWPGWRAVGFGALAGLSSSVIGMSFLYAGYGLIGVSRGAPLDAMRPLAVLGMGLLLGGALPGLPQAVGGALILGGSATLVVLHQRARAGAVEARPPMPQPLAARAEDCGAER